MGGLFTIIDNLKVKNIVIGRQFKYSENYEKFVKDVSDKGINVIVVEAGNKINIEENVDFYVLWPCSEQKISENILNNNSLVCKMKYNEFSILFTGDIEEIAEKSLMKMYESNLGILKSTVLKVAHHGSKTSSSDNFIQKVKPKYSLIGVGADNKFGHPANITIENLQNMGCKIYRTDTNGEISIRVDGRGRIMIDKMLN